MSDIGKCAEFFHFHWRLLITVHSNVINHFCLSTEKNLHFLVTNFVKKLFQKFVGSRQASIYLFKVSIRKARKRYGICSNLKTPERRKWRCSGVFIVNFEHIPHLFLVFLLPTLNK